MDEAGGLAQRVGSGFDEREVDLDRGGTFAVSGLAEPEPTVHRAEHIAIAIFMAKVETVITRIELFGCLLVGGGLLFT